MDAHTLAEVNASARVLKNVGMEFMGSAVDPDAGEVWHWGVRKTDWMTRRVTTRGAKEVD